MHLKVVSTRRVLSKIQKHKGTNGMELKRFQFILLRTVLILGIFLTVHLHSSFGESYTQMNLPDGAKARLGIGDIQDLLYSPDGKMLAVASTNGIWLYDTETYHELKLLPIPLNNSYYSLGPDIEKITFSVDGQTLVGVTEQGALQSSLLIWNVNTEECKIYELDSKVSFSPDGQKLTIGKQEPIELWQAPNNTTEEPLKEDDNEEEKVKIAFNPDGKTYATTDDQYGFSIRDTQTHKQKKRIDDTLHPVFSGEIILSPDGKLIAMLRYKSPIHVWDTNTGQLKFTLIEHPMTRLPNHVHMHYNQPFVFEGVAFSPDGNIIACGSMDGPIRLWDLNNGKLTKRLNGHDSFVNSMVFNRDGKFLATGSDDGFILVWNTETWEHVLFHDAQLFSVSCLSYNRDGSFLAAGSPTGEIFLFDVEKGIAIKSFKGHIRRVSRLMFSHDGRHLASAGWDRSVRLWDIDTAIQLKTLSAPTSRTSPEDDDYWKTLMFTHDGNLLAINDVNRFIHFWNVNTGQFKQFLLGHGHYLRCFSLSADMQTLASYSIDDTVLLWDMRRITKVVDE